ncbi:V-type ATP synthase subunit A [Treponema phagedenis]|uniref:V-type ATP synthase subunit A n=1 Tax=Treponema phagedenis TaxID=162 RepID=UPI0001F63B9A|nr:V-type ATP synthase subunit A [Treponema phagedenis]EFW38521.1 ATP synthase ab domain protein [Treponema phagedenis F0421]TYT79470.1 V-type ATP synthase subunit A [Treponema phagedenis]
MSEVITGKITRISGPILYAEGLSSCGLYDVVSVGEENLIGEIIRLDKESTTIQIYEDVTGMKIGEKVVSHRRPLSVRLGPGLIGTIYDGIQRPLEKLFDETGSFLHPGARIDPLDTQKKWHFQPALDCEGKPFSVGSPIAPGMIIGTVQETDSVAHKIMVPPNIRGRTFVSFSGEGDYTIDEIIAKTEFDENIYLAHYWPVRNPRPFTQKLTVSEPLVTGQRVIDVFFPLSKGGTAAIPGGFGTGKTMTQHAIAKWCDADIIVYIGCGERGNEMTDVLTEFPQLIDPRTNRSLMERTILIANTSNMPVAAREVSLYSGITLAEYYRDMGMHVAIMADSTSRWAEALRELSGRMEEMPAEEGFPAYLPTRLAEFYERAGRIKTLSNSEGSISIIGAVSPPGGDFSEPVTQHTKRFIRCFWALDRELANARHYPAIGWIESYSEYVDEIHEWWDKFDPRWGTVRAAALDLLKREQRLQQIVRLIGHDALPDTERIILVVSDMIKNGFLQQNAFDSIDVFSVPEKQVLILVIIMEFYERAMVSIKRGAPLIQITALNCVEKIIRIKTTYENEDIAGIQAVGEQMRKEFEELDSVYKATSY